MIVQVPISFSVNVPYLPTVLREWCTEHNQEIMLLGTTRDTETGILWDRYQLPKASTMDGLALKIKFPTCEIYCFKGENDAN